MNQIQTQITEILDKHPNTFTYDQTGIQPTTESIVNPVMKETTNGGPCRCGEKPCICILNNIVGSAPYVVSDNGGMFSGHLTIMYNTSIFPPPICSQRAKYAEAQQLISSDQLIHDYNSDTRYRKKKDTPVSRSQKCNEVTRENGTKAVARDRKYVCDTCKRSFDYKHVLQNHERTHTGEKPFSCNECQKRFTRDHHLKTHMRLHTGEKPYKCEFCAKKFVQVANLRRHLRVHTGERPYKCDFENCAQSFSDSNQLKAHILIHNDERPYACVNCNLKFRRKHHLVTHKGKCTDHTMSVINSKKNGIIVNDKSKSKLSDDTESSADSYVSTGFGGPRNDYQPPWITSPTIIPTMSDSLDMNSLILAIPMQTEPEDLSINKKYHSTNNNNSSGSAVDTSRSNSPMDEDNLV